MASPRQSALASRHKALGSELGDWNDMDVAWEYDQDVNLEHQAVRTAAGLFDVSGLKKIHITGPDAMVVADHMFTRDMTRIYPGKSAYGIILNDDGKITDDCIMFHIKPNDIMMVHGGGTGMEQLMKSAEGKDVKIEFDDDLHDISLQGPKAVDFLDQYADCNLQELKYFHHIPATLFGYHCMISRTGYSGERGYEIFAKADDIVLIWDAILENGKSEGIIPCSFNCIDMIRVEAALLFYPYDMSEKDTPWDVGLGFAVAKDKLGDYRGKEACMAAMGKETTTSWGIIADSEQAVDVDAEVFDGDKKVGFVTAPCYSTIMNASIAMVRIDKEYAKPDISLEVRGENVRCSAKTSSMPLLDPDKGKRTV